MRTLTIAVVAAALCAAAPAGAAKERTSERVIEDVLVVIWNGEYDIETGVRRWRNLFYVVDYLDDENATLNAALYYGDGRWCGYQRQGYVEARVIPGGITYFVTIPRAICASRAVSQ